MRYNLYYNTNKGSQLIDCSNDKSDLEHYVSDYKDKLDGTFEIVEKRGLIDISLIKVNNTFKRPSPEKLANYREICDNCKGKLLAANPIVIEENDHYLVDGYCSLLILKEMGVEGNIPVSLVETRNNLNTHYKLNNKEKTNESI